MATPSIFQWDSGNLDHIFGNHAKGRPYFPHQLESVFSDPVGIDRFDRIHSGSNEERRYRLGTCESGSLIRVSYIERSGSFRIITGHQVKQRVRNEYLAYSSSFAASASYWRPSDIAAGSADI